MYDVKKIDRGIEWLNENHPGWADRIDLDRLFLGSMDNCVIGQLGLHDLPKVTTNYLSEYEGIGFDEGLGFFGRGNHDELTTVWKDRIRELQTA